MDGEWPQWQWYGWGGALVLVALLGLLLWRRRRRRARSFSTTEVEKRYSAALEKFHVELDRFKFARQGAVKILLNHDHAIWTEVEEIAREGEETRESMRVRVHRYVHEIVPFFRPLAYYSIGLTVARLLLSRLYRVDFDPEEVARIKAYSYEKPRSIVYVMNHRSNADYVIAAYVLAEKLALSFAVGEWARVWPLEYIFKSFGSYFLRRGFRDRLYHTVLRRYVQLVTKNGVTQALFPEGGLSRDGFLRAPKIGLTDNIICSKEDRSFHRELVFVPVGINYDRVLEDRALVAEKDDQKVRVGRLTMLQRTGEILFGNVQKLYRHQMRKNGIAAVRFGEPISFDAWHEELGVDIFSLPKVERRSHVASFCNLLLERIAEQVPATPLCVVAKILTTNPSISRDELIAATDAEVKKLTDHGVDVVGEDRGSEWIVDGALERFTLRHLITNDATGIRVNDGAQTILAYYANAIAHFDGVAVPTVETPKYVRSH